MRMPQRTEAEQRQLATAWLSSGLTQQAFAAQHGLSGRSLRNYVRRFHRKPTAADVEVIVDRALRALQALRDQLGSARAAADAAGQVQMPAGGQPAVDATPNPTPRQPMFSR